MRNKVLTIAVDIKYTIFSRNTSSKKIFISITIILGTHQRSIIYEEYYFLTLWKSYLFHLTTSSVN